MERAAGKWTERTKQDELVIVKDSQAGRQGEIFNRVMINRMKDETSKILLSRSLLPFLFLLCSPPRP